MREFIRHLYLWEFKWESLKNLFLILSGVSILIFVVQMTLLLFTYLLPFRSVEAANVKVPEISVAKLEPIESFQKKFEIRNLFLGSTQLQPTASTKVIGIQEKIHDLSLIGVIASGEREAIVKDVKSNQTYFLKRGHKLRDLEVKEIKKGSIVLKSGDEEKEIFLA